MVERQLPKLHTRVRFPSPAPGLKKIFEPSLPLEQRRRPLAVVDGSLGTIPQALHSLGMATDPKTTEWNLLKDRFDAQVHNEEACSNSIETLSDDHIRRRFGASIAGAVERKTKSDA